MPTDKIPESLLVEIAALDAWHARLAAAKRDPIAEAQIEAMEAALQADRDEVLRIYNGEGKP